MSRDPVKLEAFVMADALVIEVYKATRSFPIEEPLPALVSALAEA